jgi:opacity protein-like surface antigen
MKTIRYYGFFLIFITFWMPINVEASCLSGFEVETKVSVFIPSSKIIRRIYSDAMPCYEFGISKKFCNDWQVCLDAGYVSDRGHAIGCKKKTNFRFIPLTLVLKYYYPLSSCIDCYAGLGPSWSFFKNKDHSHFVHKSISKEALGAIFKLGFIYAVKDYIFLDIFTEYLSQHFSFKRHYADHYTIRHHLNMSGLKIGVGLGFNF